MGDLTQKARNKMATIYGTLAGLLYIVIDTIGYTKASNIKVSQIIFAVGFLVLFVSIGIFAARIKKANGGYLDFKNTYAAVIIMILISGALFYIYYYVYIEYFDKEYIYRLKAGTIANLESQRVSTDSVRVVSAQWDKQITESKNFSLANNLLNFCRMILVNSLLGLIVAVIVKKNKPAFE